MNNAQKAQAWVDTLKLFGAVHDKISIKYITTLLKEREALLDAVKDSLSGYKYIEQTHGKLYGLGSERVIEKCEQAIQLCEADSSARGNEQ